MWQPGSASCFAPSTVALASPSPRTNFKKTVKLVPCGSRALGLGAWGLGAGAGAGHIHGWGRGLRSPLSSSTSWQDLVTAIWCIARISGTDCIGGCRGSRRFCAACWSSAAARSNSGCRSRTVLALHREFGGVDLEPECMGANCRASL